MSATSARAGGFLPLKKKTAINPAEHIMAAKEKRSSGRRPARSIRRTETAVAPTCTLPMMTVPKLVLSIPASTRISDEKKITALIPENCCASINAQPMPNCIRTPFSKSARSWSKAVGRFAASACFMPAASASAEGSIAATPSSLIAAGWRDWRSRSASSTVSRSWSSTRRAAPSLPLLARKAGVSGRRVSAHTNMSAPIPLATHARSRQDDSGPTHLWVSASHDHSFTMSSQPLLGPAASHE
mmetsp:Transcript_37700/g.88196  ORF Transcript_37700/g.88196 Transcript_37700/m.88196 type:complete len:243 (-) Transcript_37700:578-1306(-)